jgi:hypothetical protein
MVSAIQRVAFLAGAISVAWLGAFTDTFLVNLDEATSRHLGDPDVGYPVVLVLRVLAALLGALAFCIAGLFLRSGIRCPVASGVRAGLWGAGYSAAVVGLLHVTAWLNTGVAVLGLWIGIIVLPVGAAWALAREGTARAAQQGDAADEA